MIHKIFLIALVLVCIAGLASCSSRQADPTSQDNIANPASVYCKQQGYQSKIVTAADGSQGGLCIFPDGGSCDEWAYYRGQCGPAGKKVAPAPATSLPSEYSWFAQPEK